MPKIKEPHSIVVVTQSTRFCRRYLSLLYQTIAAPTALASPLSLYAILLRYGAVLTTYTNQIIYARFTHLSNINR